MTSARKSKCIHCAQPLVEKPVVNAKDADRYIGEYGSFDDDLVWIARDGNAICYGSNTAHNTAKEWGSGQ